MSESYNHESYNHFLTKPKIRETGVGKVLMMFQFADMCQVLNLYMTCSTVNQYLPIRIKNFTLIPELLNFVNYVTQDICFYEKQ